MPYIETITEQGDTVRKFVGYSQAAHVKFSSLVESARRANEQVEHVIVVCAEHDETFAKREPSEKEVLARDFDRTEAKGI
jgi:hypothetical protein